MKLRDIIILILKWLPTVAISIFYILNAVDKIIDSNQNEKVISNSSVMISTGIFLLVSVILFFYNKTMFIGTFLLSLYMTLIVFIHIYKDKPFEVAALIVISTIFACYIRNPKQFN
ncbi:MULTISPECIES: hypothetical protein [Mesoflavibacter]|uniref:hypothetical protein n=1 Tax=Mesoflavibacter TaxID=444051 RepID=UPI000482389E|nr:MULTISPECIES: hypothetical protein [Mesoflavibacter]